MVVQCYWRRSGVGSRKSLGFLFVCSKGLNVKDEDIFPAAV